MRTLGWGLIAVGALFALATAHAIRTGVIVDRSIRTARATDPRGFRRGLLFLGGYAAGVALLGLLILGIA